MTTDVRRRPGWQVTTFLAPCAAAVFGAAVWWATDTLPSTAQPATATGSSASAASAAAAAQRAAAQQRRQLHRELEQNLARERHQYRDLAARLREVRNATSNARRAAAYVPPPVSYPAAAAPVAMPAAPAAPPVQATTGASGAVR